MPLRRGNTGYRSKSHLAFDLECGDLSPLFYLKPANSGKAATSRGTPNKPIGGFHVRTQKDRTRKVRYRFGRGRRPGFRGLRRQHRKRGPAARGRGYISKSALSEMAERVWQAESERED